VGTVSHAPVKSLYGRPGQAADSKHTPSRHRSDEGQEGATKYLRYPQRSFPSSAERM